MYNVMSRKVTFIVLIFSLWSNCFSYEISAPKIDAYYPEGFQLSIPSVEGITKIIFKGKLTEQLKEADVPTWNEELTTPVDGHFKYVNSSANIRIGDVLYYVLEVTYNNRIQERQGIHVVVGYTNKVGLINPWQPPKSLYSGLCNPSVTVVNGIQQPCAGRLIFNEIFSGPLDTTKWTPQERIAAEPDYEFVTYLKRGDVIFTRDGYLIVKPTVMTDFYGFTVFNKGLTLNMEPDCTGEWKSEQCLHKNIFDIVPPIASGQITTKGYFSFMYGKVSIRARVPDIKWAFPQFFLEPTDNAYGKLDYASGQMRIAFTNGIDMCSLSGGVIINAENRTRKQNMCVERCQHNQKWSADFHVYELKWTPNQISLSVDGEPFCTIGPMRSTFFSGIDGELIPTLNWLRPMTEIAPFDRHFHLTIGLGIGGHNDYADSIQNKPWQNFHPRATSHFWKSVNGTHYPSGILMVDYVKVFTV